MNITENESVFLQALSFITLITKLYNCDFLNSDYYKKLYYEGNDDFFKYVLDNSGLGNPATMQMFLYILLVMPREIFNKQYSEYKIKCREEINTLCAKLVESSTYSTYTGENNICDIDYYKHIRNAISHAECHYFKNANICFVKLCDVNIYDISQKCYIVMTTEKMGEVLNKLVSQLIDFVNMKLKERSENNE